MELRNITFRGKRLDGGEWVEGNYYESDMSGCFILQNIQKKTVNARTGVFSMRDVPIPYEVDPDTVGQYTGLTDKNGKKIFEGDLLKRLPSKNEGPYEVYWENEDYAWRIRLDHYPPDDFSGFDSEEWVVIGNIWDNPELLEVKK